MGKRKFVESNEGPCPKRPAGHRPPEGHLFQSPTNTPPVWCIYCDGYAIGQVLPATKADYRSHAEALAAALEGLIAEQEQYMTDERTDEAIATARAALSAWRSLKDGR